MVSVDKWHSLLWAPIKREGGKRNLIKESQLSCVGRGGVKDSTNESNWSFPAAVHWCDGPLCNSLLIVFTVHR